MTQPEYIFYKQTDKYALKKVNEDLVIIFYRDAGSIELSDKLPHFNTAPEEIPVHGLLGIQRLLSGDVIMLITSVEEKGTILGESIYQITESELFPMARNHCYLTLEQATDEEKYFKLLKQTIRRENFYFSKKLDLSNNFQTLLKENVQGVQFKNFNPMFCWNYLHLAPFMEVTKEDPLQDFTPFLIPVVSGFVSLNQVSIENQNLSYNLISRRSWQRVGTRYFSRGIDNEGNVSNFVESEQIIEVKDSNNHLQVLSYLQTRGSIPLFWAQVTNTKYTPKLVIDKKSETPQVMKQHFNKMISDYNNGEVVVINLINQKGYELPIFEELSLQLKNLNHPKVIHMPFDFHKECAKMRWDRISLLIEQLLPNLEKQGFFQYDFTDKNVIKQQIGIMRTNCMDCLDRTNVVQSILAKTVLTQQLQTLGIFQQIENYNEQFNYIYRNLWADHANAISIVYSGTGALKTDFTRTGNRTKIGALQDLRNSIVRYIKNNYLDGQRQDGLDLFLHKYIPSQNLPSPFENSFNFIYYLAIACFFTSISLFTLPWFTTISYPWSSLFSFGSIALLLSTAFAFVKYPQSFVDRPNLVQYEYDYKLQKNQISITVEKGLAEPVLIKGKFD
ncbi:hypothetical protein K502DRAFT_311669 [Neoconidiobolus thromboides FSU 785]|nr:hypothetical protein K502DRAFT_311669 [Neoconidiobolus thromboides FSU 785]